MTKYEVAVGSSGGGRVLLGRNQVVRVWVAKAQSASRKEFPMFGMGIYEVVVTW